MSTSTRSALALRLRELRGDMTQQMVAECMNVSAASVSSWEGGLAVPPERRLLQYARYFAPRRADALMQELVSLRALASPIQHEQTQQTLLEVMKDIRWLLSDISRRLPPRRE